MGPSMSVDAAAIKRAVRIEYELARRGIQLRRAGAEMIGPCPVCGGRDRFGVNLHKQVFNCRGCNQGGDVITLVRLLDGVDFETACEVLTGEATAPQRSIERPSVVTRDDQNSRQRAAHLWREAVPIESTPAELYLTRSPPYGRGLEVPDGVSGSVLRFHPSCPFLDYAQDPPTRTMVPAMVALFRSIADDGPVAIHRTALTLDGRKAALPKSKLTLGPISGAAIKLSTDEDVTYGLAIGEGIETTLAGMMKGFQPAWALGSSGAIRYFPVLAGVDALTILVDNDEPKKDGRRPGPDAADECAARWSAANREVFLVMPTTAGADMCDVLASRRDGVP